MRKSTLILLTGAVSLALGYASAAPAQTLTIDDFTTGPAHALLNGANQTGTLSAIASQRGTGIIGKERSTSLELLASNNPFAQNASFQIAPETSTAPAALVYSGGYGADAVMVWKYGSLTVKDPKSLKANLAAYDRFRVHLLPLEGGAGLAIEAWKGSNYDAWGCLLAPTQTAETVDFPLANASGNISLASVDGLLFETENFGVGGVGYAITLVEMVPAGTPAGDVTCAPLAAGKPPAAKSHG